jgi:hypothetical protein
MYSDLVGSAVVTTSYLGVVRRVAAQKNPTASWLMDAE